MLLTTDVTSYSSDPTIRSSMGCYISKVQFVKGYESSERSFQNVILEDADVVPQQWKVMSLDKGFAPFMESYVQFTKEDTSTICGRTITHQKAMWVSYPLWDSNPWPILYRSLVGVYGTKWVAKPSMNRTLLFVEEG